MTQDENDLARVADQPSVEQGDLPRPTDGLSAEQVQEELDTLRFLAERFAVDYRELREQFEALARERDTLRSEHEHTWTCSCGWRNGCNLYACAQCSRRPGGEENPCVQDENCIHATRLNALEQRVIALTTENLKLQTALQNKVRSEK